MNRKMALLTGGSRGIGSAIHSALIKTGWNVIAPTRSDLDLASSESIKSFLASLSQPISGLVLNAGINEPAPLSELSLEAWLRVQQVNSTASFELISGLAPAMARTGFGRIVGISSSYVDRSRLGRSAYSASKASLESLIRSTAIEYAEFGVVANCVAPGFVDTDLTHANNSPEMIEQLVANVPVGRLAKVEEIGSAVAFLMSFDNAYITGQTLRVDGGFSCR